MVPIPTKTFNYLTNTRLDIDASLPCEVVLCVMPAVVVAAQRSTNGLKGFVYGTLRAINPYLKRRGYYEYTIEYAVGQISSGYILSTGHVYTMFVNSCFMEWLDYEIGRLQTGPRGPAGVKGDTGDQGIQGVQGDQGPQGLQGIPGEQGEQGLQGIPGEQGEQGEQGLQGIPGEQGEQGEQGLQGVQGIQGIQGIQGVPGTEGPPGPSLHEAIYGDGSDGNLTVAAGSEYNGGLVRNGYWNTLNIPAGQTFYPYGENKITYVIRARNLTIDGLLDASASSTLIEDAVGGAGGGTMPSGEGGDGEDTVNAAVEGGSIGFYNYPYLGGDGGAGGSGGGGSGASGGLSQDYFKESLKHLVWDMLVSRWGYEDRPEVSSRLAVLYGGNAGAGGGGGGKNGAAAGGKGGNGGLGGGSCLIIAENIVIGTTGKIWVKGAPGETPVAAAGYGAGGGGGGGGGAIILIYKTLSTVAGYELNVSGGSAGLGGIGAAGNGNAGAPGSAGVVIKFNLSTMEFE